MKDIAKGRIEKVSEKETKGTRKREKYGVI